MLGSDKLVRYCALAGESALAAHAPEQALVHFERALAARGDDAVDDRAAEVLFGLGRAQLATLGHDELGPAVTSLRRAFDHYVAVGDISPAARSRLPPASAVVPLRVHRRGRADRARSVAGVARHAGGRPASRPAGRVLGVHRSGLRPRAG